MFGSFNIGCSVTHVSPKQTRLFPSLLPSGSFPHTPDASLPKSQLSPPLSAGVNPPNTLSPSGTLHIVVLLQ